MAVWKVSRLGRVSSLTGEPFPPDTEIVTALFGEEEESGEDKVRGSGFVRQDYRVDEASDELLASAYCLWRTRTPPEQPRGTQRLDLDMAREFLQRLLDDKNPEKAPVAFALALILIRKRRLRMLGQTEDRLEVSWPRQTETFHVPAPELTEADTEALEQELKRLFDL